MEQLNDVAQKSKNKIYSLEIKRPKYTGNLYSLEIRAVCTRASVAICYVCVAFLCSILVFGVKIAFRILIELRHFASVLCPVCVWWLLVPILSARVAEMLFVYVCNNLASGSHTHYRNGYKSEKQTIQLSSFGYIRCRVRVSANMLIVGHHTLCSAGYMSVVLACVYNLV